MVHLDIAATNVLVFRYEQVKIADIEIERLVERSERGFIYLKKEKLHRRAKSTISDHQVFHAVCNVVFS